mmetsp:Transcript_79841/g.234839  ORF Transcript_79841/g.234839 Transcript_79841/m.234839 type:complete len:504 (+) Transcript_79841:112-1623(+)
MPHCSKPIQQELTSAPDGPQLIHGATEQRWRRHRRQDASAPKSVSVDSASEATPSTTPSDAASDVSSADACTTPPSPPPSVLAAPLRERQPRPVKGRSFCMQHYHSTGCAGGAFAMRAAKMNPDKSLFMCKERREFRITTIEDIAFSLHDKQHGQGPRVGSFQRTIPGNAWEALPKYDYSTQKRSCAFNERMHVEWENHVDHMLSNSGELPTASVVAKAGFRSCAPCCRDMLALARPTGKTFIMVDLAEQDDRGTFHFVCGDKYLPVPKEYLESNQVTSLKQVVLNAQDGVYACSEDIYDAVLDLGVPVDTQAQALYLGDRALLPTGCATGLQGDALLEVLHAEHFARLTAEYGASILRDSQQPEAQKRAILACRARAEQMLVTAWAPNLAALQLQLRAYAAAACSPLLPDAAEAYAVLRRSNKLPHAATSMQLPQARRPRVWKVSRPGTKVRAEAFHLLPSLKGYKHDDEASSVCVSTAVPDDNASTLNGDVDDTDVEDDCL